MWDSISEELFISGLAGSVGVVRFASAEVLLEILASLPLNPFTGEVIFVLFGFNDSCCKFAGTLTLDWGTSPLLTGTELLIKGTVELFACPMLLFN